MYAALSQSASRAITKYGRSITVRRVTNTGTKAWEPSQSNTDYSVTAVVRDANSGEVDGTRILAQDRFWQIAAADLAITPEPGDRVVDTDEYQVLDVSTTKPGTTALLHLIHGRR